MLPLGFDDDDEQEEDIEQGSTELPFVIAVQPIRNPKDEPYVFRFEVGPAILQQLLVKLKALDTIPLSKAVKAKHPGFYQLFLDGNPVYVGKTSRTVEERLKEHVKKLTGRIQLERMTCKFAYVEDPSLVDISEGALIGFFDQLDAAEWNHSGFGSKVTGYNRGKQSGSDWSTLYPPDLSWKVEAGNSIKNLRLDQVIRQVSKEAPITLSIPNKQKQDFRAAHPSTLKVKVESKPFTEWIAWIESQLKSGWRVERVDSGWYVTKEK